MLALLIAASEIGRDEVEAVLVALLVALLVGVLVYLFPPGRPYAGPVALLTFIVLLLLLLLS